MYDVTLLLPAAVAADEKKRQPDAYFVFQLQAIGIFQPVWRVL